MCVRQRENSPLSFQMILHACLLVVKGMLAWDFDLVKAALAWRLLIACLACAGKDGCVPWLVNELGNLSTHWCTRAELAAVLGSLARIPALSAAMVSPHCPSGRFAIHISQPLSP